MDYVEFGYVDVDYTPEPYVRDNYVDDGYTDADQPSGPTNIRPKRYGVLQFGRLGLRTLKE